VAKTIIRTSEERKMKKQIHSPKRGQARIQINKIGGNKEAYKYTVFSVVTSPGLLISKILIRRKQIMS